MGTPAERAFRLITTVVNTLSHLTSFCEKKPNAFDNRLLILDEAIRLFKQFSPVVDDLVCALDWEEPPSEITKLENMLKQKLLETVETFSKAPLFKNRRMVICGRGVKHS